MRRLGLRYGTAREQASRWEHSLVPFAKLPSPLPENLRRTSAELEIPETGFTRSLHFCGDTGGVLDPHPQAAVVGAMLSDLAENPSVAAMYHLGDIGYFLGTQESYVNQLFEAYEGYPRHILGVPGNHDGASYDELTSFMRYLCDPTPRLLPEMEEFGRDTMDQPYCYWTLLDPLVTIIGLYSNVPSGGHIEQTQYEWLVGELRNAPKGVTLLVALHHPPYSIDAHHGGSARMGTVLDKAFAEAGRWPEVVISGHVHDYQRFTRKVPGGSMLYIVCGNGGYHNLHALARDAAPNLQVAPDLIFNYGDDQNWGFLHMDFTPQGFSGEYNCVSRAGSMRMGDDRFTAKLL
jgi:hypothetical protein